jgi:hypothetical protein
MASEQYESAAQRLDAAVLEQDRLTERYDAAIGTSTELGAYTRLRAVGAQVAAREAWFNWVNDETYRGLNAGPFELLAETSGRQADARQVTPSSFDATEPQ